MTENNTYVICKVTGLKVNTIFVNNQLFTTRGDAEIALVKFKKEDLLIREELKELGNRTEYDYELEIMALGKFLEHLAITMFDAGCISIQ